MQTFLNMKITQPVRRNNDKCRRQFIWLQKKTNPFLFECMTNRSDNCCWRKTFVQGSLTLTTGCALGIMGAAGGTAWTLEVMVGTGVAAITGVWGGCGGELGHDEDGEVEDSAEACWVSVREKVRRWIWDKIKLVCLFKVAHLTFIYFVSFNGKLHILEC